MRYIFLPVLCALLTLNAAGEEDESPWSGAVELGLIFTTGNTETISAKNKIKMKQKLTSWINEYKLSAVLEKDQVSDEITGDDELQKTAEKYFASFKTNYQPESDKAKLFIFLSHTDDKFGGVAKYSTFAVGWGNRIFATQHTSLDADIGPGYAEGEQADGEKIRDVILRASAQYQWEISENAKLTQEVSTEAGEDNVRTLSESSITTKINSSLQMKFGVSLTHNSEVSDDTKNTDTESTITVVYSF